MNEQEHDERFLKRLQAELAAGDDLLDQEVQARLREGRQAAVAKAGHRRWSLMELPRWVTASGFATAAVLVVAVSLWIGTGQRNLPSTNVDDMELMTSQEQLDLYEDLEFYRWLAESSRDR